MSFDRRNEFTQRSERNMEKGRRSMPPRTFFRTITGLVPIFATAITACSETPPTAAPGVPLTSIHVTETVAATLTDDGRFALPAPVVNPSGQLSEVQAKAISLRYVRDIAPSKLRGWIAEHGAAIEPSTLTPCDRALYAASPYVSLNGGNLSEITVRTFGSHWVIPMCGSAHQVEIVISFSALATELAIDAGPSGRPLPWERSDVMSFGIPIGAVGSLYSPEAAALYAFTTTGKRVNSVPELVMNPMPQSPVLVRWRVDLEGPVVVKGTRSAISRQRATVLVGFEETFGSSGLLDSDPQAGPSQLSWIDPVTKSPFTVTLSPRAPGGVELVKRGNP